MTPPQANTKQPTNSPVDVLPRTVIKTASPADSNTSPSETSSSETSSTGQPRVTLVIGPRERFSYTRSCLKSIYQNTDYPFDLVFVDVCSPAPVRRYIEQQSQEKSFEVIRTDCYISPNQARNVGLRRTLERGQAKYIVFVENDVIVKRGWLTKLVACAEETNAAVVGPLTCIGNPAHQVIHNAGGRSYIKSDVKRGQPRRLIKQSAYLTGRAIADVTDQLHRTQCDYVEFHCMLARTSIFEQTGLLDEGMMATREHIDFCFMVAAVGGTVFSEREAVITTDTIGLDSNKAGLMKWFGKLSLPDFKPYDLGYFMLRWSDSWDLASLHHLRDKWQLTEDKYFRRRYAGLGSRRRELLVKPLVRWLTLGQGSARLENWLGAIERKFNHRFYAWYTRRHSAPGSNSSQYHPSTHGHSEPSST
ncbi:MAG: glycosyltransferase [Cyanobacteria bacterium J06607_13]